MFRIFFPTQRVPEWLEKQEPLKGLEDQFKPGKLQFGDVCIVYAKSGAFHVRGITGGGPVLKITDAQCVCLVGQSPKNGNRGVKIYPGSGILPIVILSILTAIELLG